MCEVILMLFGRRVCVSFRKTWQVANFCVGIILFPFLIVLDIHSFIFLIINLSPKSVIVLFILFYAKQTLQEVAVVWYALTMKYLVKPYFCRPACRHVSWNFWCSSHFMHFDRISALWSHSFCDNIIFNDLMQVDFCNYFWLIRNELLLL